MIKPSDIIAELESDFIELHKLLKFEGLTESGGRAKQAIAKGLVNVNGEVETQKRKKINPGDKVEYSGQTINVIGKQNN